MMPDLTPDVLLQRPTVDQLPPFQRLL